MLQRLPMMLEWSSYHRWFVQPNWFTQMSWFTQTNGDPLLAQAAITPGETAWTLLSGPQFFVALIAGVVMSFAFQFLLTNFSVAAGISAGDDLFETDSKSWGKKLRVVEARIGGGTIVIVNTALFIACFLAVKLSLIADVTLAAIISVVIWSVYFLLLLWAGSRAVGSLVGSVGDAVGTGLQGVVGTVATALSGRAVNAQVVNTVEASVEAVTKQLRSAIAPNQVRENVEDYLGNLQLPQLNLSDVRSQFVRLLKNADLASIADSDLLNTVNRETFVNLINNRTDLSKQDVEQIADQLEGAWRQVLGQKSGTNDQESQTNGQESQPDPQTALFNILGSSMPGPMQTGQLGDRLQQLMQPQQNQQESGLRDQVLRLGLGTLASAVLQRTDLSKLNASLPNLDTEKLGEQLNTLRQQLVEQAGKASNAIGDPRAVAFNALQTDIENYLLNSPSWYLNPDSLDRGFREVIYDPEADPGMVRQQLKRLNRNHFMEVLNRREGALPQRINDIADELEVIRREVLDTVQVAEAQERSQDLRHRVEDYLHAAPKEELNSEGIRRDFTALIADPEASYEVLGNRLIQFDRDTLMQMLLAGRQDLSEEEAEQILNHLESTRDLFLNRSREEWDQLQTDAAGLRQRVEEYLQNAKLTELDTQGIQSDLRTLLEDPQAGVLALRTRLAQFDRDTLVQLLAQRQDLSEEQVNRVIDQIEAVRDNILHVPQQLAGQVQEQYDRIVSQISEYLRNTKLEELNPEGIQRDLTKLFSNPQLGTSALRDRLSQVDRDTLVRLLSQRGDLSEAQINQTIDQVQDTIRRTVRAPRRLAARAAERVRDFPTDLADYLRNTKKEELNPDSIKRDLQLLLNQPEEGLDRLGDRLSQFDRSTLVALLSQREDISEEEANQIVDRIESVRDQLVQQVRDVQERIQAVVDGIFAQIREYLNSLDRPELNYESIQRDFRKLFDDPEAGLEALGDRFKQVDRDTLVALLSSRSDISEEQANRIADQIESARDNVLGRAKWLQEEAEKQIEKLQKQAKEQAKEAQKTIATAAWWLFGTALTSVATAAIAGAIAAGGLPHLG